MNSLILQRLLVAFACLAGPAGLARAQTSGLKLESLNAEEQGGKYHVLKLVHTGTERFTGMVAIRRMRCQMEPPAAVDDRDPARARIRETLARMREASTGRLVFGGSVADLTIDPGSWLVLRIAQVPRDVTRCEVEMFWCGKAGDQKDCVEGRAIELRTVASPRRSSGFTVQLDSSNHRMRAGLEGDVFMQLREIVNTSSQQVHVQHASSQERIEGCQARPVPFATTDDVVDRLRGGFFLEPGQRMYWISALKIDSATRPACTVTSTFLETWRDSKGELVHKEMVTDTESLNLLGSTAQFIETAVSEIDYD